MMKFEKGAYEHHIRVLLRALQAMTAARRNGSALQSLWLMFDKALVSREIVFDFGD